jgi:hypothetical protein
MKQLKLIFFFLVSCISINAQVNHWETAIYGTDTFRYFIGNQEPPADWKSIKFNDSNWLKGKGGLGYGENNLNSIVPDSTLSIYIRKNFNIEDSTSIFASVLNIDYDDGFAAWINGTEVARANLGITGDIPAFNTPAASNHEGLMHQGFLPESFVIENLKTKNTIRNGKNVICMQVNNISNTSSDLTAILYLSFGIKNASHYYDTIPYWLIPPKLTEGSLLPLIIINTNGQWIPHIPDKIQVDFGIIDNGPGNYNYSTDSWNYFSSKAGLGVHGSSSTMFDKKNYGLELRDAAGVQLDTSILGLPTENDFILYGPYPDKSLMRNYIMYYLGNDIGQYAPRTRMCEVYMDGDYRGYYLLVEKIKRDKNRVNIKKLESTDVSGIKLTGGYIVKIDRTGANYTDGWYSPYPFLNTNIFFVFDYPKYTDILSAQKLYIQNKVTFFETQLNGVKYTDPVYGYRSVIDSKSFAEHLILSEFCKNVDAYRLSTFIYKNRDDVDPLLHMGPIWDYDLAFGNANYDDASIVTGWEYNYPEAGQPFWWQRLMSDPWFANLTKCRYEELRKGALNTDSINLFIDSTIAKMGPAIQRNFNRWPILGTWVWPNNFVGNTYLEEINYLKQWIKDRAVWMDNNMPGLCVVSDVSHEVSSVFEIRAFPNPAVGNINIELQNPVAEDVLIEVFNLYGQLSFSRQIKGSNYHLENISLAPGTYLLRATSASDIKTTKFVIY